MRSVRSGVVAVLASRWLAVRADHPVARNDDGNRCPSNGAGGRAQSVWPSDRLCEFRIVDCCAVRDLVELLPYGPLKRSSDEIKAAVEGGAGPGEVLRELVDSV